MTQLQDAIYKTMDNYHEIPGNISDCCITDTMIIIETLMLRESFYSHPVVNLGNVSDLKNLGQKIYKIFK